MKAPLVKPTESELEILNILWEKGPSSVREIHDTIIQTKKEAGYTTALKTMQIMLDKGLLRRDDSSRTHVYEAAITREQTQGQMLRRMIDNVFNGSASQLVMQALGNHKASAKELEQIRQYLDTLGRKGKK